MDISNEALVTSVMEMREMTEAIIKLKMEYPSEGKKHRKDLEDLAKLLRDYDKLLRKLLEMYMKQDEMHNNFVNIANKRMTQFEQETNQKLELIRHEYDKALKAAKGE